MEAAFRRMKDPHSVSWKQLHHWTDQKIRVHSLYRVLALTSLALLHRRQACDAGIAVSAPALIEELNSIEGSPTSTPLESPRSNFNDYWQFHEDREHERNHASKYADGRVPTISEPSHGEPAGGKGTSGPSTDQRESGNLPRFGGTERNRTHFI